jgi:predicted adenylyl cyclase CyaB
MEVSEANLLNLNPPFMGTDSQTDTYFNVAEGRLKLREGNIENALIFYERENVEGAKQSDVILYKHTPDPSLKDILIKVHGVKIVVNKVRKIYFLGNVKFHFDTVEQLGTFIEVEAIDSDGKIGIKKLEQQCEEYAEILGIKPSDFISVSYSDLIMEL